MIFYSSVKIFNWYFIRDPEASSANMATNPFWEDDEYGWADTCPCCAMWITPQPPWMSRYRALYLTETGTKLSNVNTSEYDWDHLLYEDEETWTTITEKLGPWFTMTGIRPKKVTLFHELCWLRLLQNLEGEDIDLDKMFQVCRNIGLHLDNSGGPAQLEEFDIRNSQPTIPRPEYVADAPPPPNKALACVKKILRYHLQIPRLPHQLFATKTPLSVDCFNSLPMEINLQIAIHLDTASFLDLRYVSRAMANVFHIQSFWKSRFELSQDRGYLNCLKDNFQNERTDWRLIFRRTANLINVFVEGEDDKTPEVVQQSGIFEHLCTMKELWMQAQWLKERYTMTKPPERQISLHKDLLIPDSKRRWKEFDVSSSSNSSWQRDRESCQGQNQWTSEIYCDEHAPLVQAIPLEVSTIGLAVSILREGLTTVITGFELLGDSKTPNLVFGYRIPGRQVVIDLRGKSLRGFTVFSSRGNIHALYPVFSEKNVQSNWIGQPKTCNGPGDLFLEPSVWTYQKKSCRGSLDPLRGLCDSRQCARTTKTTDLILNRGIAAFCGKFDVKRPSPSNIADNLGSNTANIPAVLQDGWAIYILIV